MLHLVDTSTKLTPHRASVRHWFSRRYACTVTSHVIERDGTWFTLRRMHTTLSTMLVPHIVCVEMYARDPEETWPWVKKVL
jgi:hypothetical protein